MCGCNQLIKLGQEVEPEQEPWMDSFSIAAKAWLTTNPFMSKANGPHLWKYFASLARLISLPWPPRVRLSFTPNQVPQRDCRDRRVIWLPKCCTEAANHTSQQSSQTWTQWTTWLDVTTTQPYCVTHMRAHCCRTSAAVWFGRSAEMTANLQKWQKWLRIQNLHLFWIYAFFRNLQITV